MIRKISYLSIFVFCALLAFSCNNKKEEKVKTLTFSISVEIPVPEPSGLDLSYDEKAFWIVSDRNGKVYLIDRWGKEIRSFKVDGESLEGITVVDENTLAIVLEKTREVVILDTSGNELKRAALDIEGELNSGLEGITYDPKEKKFYILNEKKPLLLVTLDEKLNELRRDTLNFSKDVSGIYFDTSMKILWILSDESQKIVQTDLRGKPIQEFKIKVTQPEGITLNKAGSKLYLVSDKTGSLYVFNLQ